MKQKFPVKRSFIIGVVLFQFVCATARADDAVVLPKGGWQLLTNYGFSLPVTRRFDADGNLESLATDLNANLNSSVFPALSALDPFVPGGTASIGTSVISFKRHTQELTVVPGYGLTDKLSVGLIIRYKWKQNDVSARLDTSNANVGNNSAQACGAPICPLSVPGTVPLTTEDAQNLLQQGFGMKPVESWRDQGLGDLDAGMKYQYFRSESWRLAFTGGVRFPTGEYVDQDSLVAEGFGSGTYALLFRFHQDYTRQPEGIGKKLGIPDPGAFTVNTTFRYALYLPDHQELRVCGVHVPLCPTKENVKRDLGDVAEFEISGGFGLPLKGLSFSPRYTYTHGFKNHYKGHSALADETNFEVHRYAVGLSYSTIPLFVEKRFPLPLNAGITYSSIFRANNNTAKTQTISLTIAAYF